MRSIFTNIRNLQLNLNPISMTKKKLELICIVDELSLKDISITRYLEEQKDGSYIETQYLNDKNYNTKEKKSSLTKNEAMRWKKNFVPDMSKSKLVHAHQPGELLYGYSRNSLYQYFDGRFFSISEKMNDFDYNLLTTTIWLAKEGEKAWLRKFHK